MREGLKIRGKKMKIIFSEKFYETDYASDCAAVSGRLEVIISALQQDKSFEFIAPPIAAAADILLTHSPEYFASAQTNAKSYNMAMLSAGAAKLAAETGMNGEPAFACIRPPGHHASVSSTWGYCVFCNMGVALLSLRARNLIDSAFVLDFDAHTGDGTKDVLGKWKECHILNPYQETSETYLKEIQDYIRDIQTVGIVGVCAGFDSYEKDVGRKLTTFDFYQIGFYMKKFAQRAANGRRFAILEGGYYLPDLGKNVLAFCQGFQ